MKLYRLKIKLKSSYITPWQSDTILGSLTWILVQNEGERKLKDFFQRYKEGSYPFVVSNAFPGNMLIKPMAGNLFPVKAHTTKDEEISIAEKAKKAKSNDLLTLEEFNAIIDNGLIEISDKSVTKQEVLVMHNQINRITGTSIEGGLFEQHEVFWGDNYLSIYAAIEDEWVDKFYDLFKGLAIKGYGKRSSIGKGGFEILEFVEYNGFKKINNPNCFVTMSNYIPKEKDPLDGQYSIFVKHGKLGQHFSNSENPFKKPLIMLRPGAVFWTNNPKNAYGRLVFSVSESYPEVAQFGVALAIPANIEKPKNR